MLLLSAGGTAAALAYDLTLCGFVVSLFEKADLLSGTTGRHHGLLPSGARYAVHDPAAIREGKISLFPSPPWGERVRACPQLQEQFYS